MPRRVVAIVSIAVLTCLLTSCAHKTVTGTGALTAISASPTPGVTSSTPVGAPTATAGPTSTHRPGGGSTTHPPTASPSTSAAQPIRDYAVYWDRDDCQMARGGGGDVLAMSFEIKYEGPGAATDTTAYWSDAEGGDGLLDSGTADEPTSKWTTDTNPQTVTGKATISFLDTSLSNYEGKKLTLTITIHPADPDTDGYDDQAVEYVNVPDSSDLPPEDSTLHYITCQ
ncbi:MAG TPA: hypothetical protein VKB59_21415 [Micromonosporaceae bacterium]|nr:hypothetical protein [Micromonosporaceae bacterium]